MPEGKESYTLEELRELFLAYDKKYGNYRESPYEGFALWEWLTQKPVDLDDDDSAAYTAYDDAHTARYNEWKEAMKK